MGRALKTLAGLYALLLAASWLRMGVTPSEPALPDGRSAIEVAPRAGSGEPLEPGSARIAYLDLGDPSSDEAVLLLHGSPGDCDDFRALRGPLAAARRVLVPDLPGFGASQRVVPDYSLRAHAGYALALLDELGIAHVHAVGFSMGGGVALELADRAPERVRSITLLASIGVEELELLGDHELNHGLHLLQLGAFRAARWLVPHFGALDSSFLSWPYARNFADTDQRRLRPILESLGAPTLILHGEKDFLVPVAKSPAKR